jgi:hypothetical protein
MQTANLAFSTAGVISLLVGFVLPILVGYFTKASLNPGLKAAILAATAGLSGVLTQWLDAINNNQHFAWQAAVLSAVATWITAEASYLRIWKPSGVSDVVQAAGPIADPPTTTTAKHAATDSVTQEQIDTGPSYKPAPDPAPPVPTGSSTASTTTV